LNLGDVGIKIQKRGAGKGRWVRVREWFAVGIEPGSSAGKTCAAARAAEATLGATAKPLQQAGLPADYG